MLGPATYDARGNRLTAVVTGANPSSQTLTYNAANQITTTGYGYDGAGNLTQAPGTTYTYNEAQQMVQADVYGVTTSYVYAGADQKRILYWGTPGYKDFYFVYGRDDQSGNPTITSYGRQGEESHVLSDPATGQPTLLATSNNVQGLYVFDTIGNPVGLLVNNPNAYSVTYDPYGVETVTYGDGGTGAEQTPYMFKGGIKDRASELVKFGVRWYSNVTGTWTQQDTLDSPFNPANANRYAFAGSDPVNLSDATGLAVSACKTNTKIAAGAGTVAASLGVGAFLLGPTVIGPVSLGAAAAATTAFAGVFAVQAAVDCSLGL